MFEGFTILGTLRRLLVVATKTEKSLASLADTQELLLKIRLLEKGSSVEELRDYQFPSASDQGWVDDQDEEELAEMERQEAAIVARGGEVDEEKDLGILYKQWMEVESGKK